MANFLRTAKLGNDWSQVELHAYNIVVELQDAATFFGVNVQPSTTTVCCCRTPAADDVVNDANYKFVRYVDLAMDPVPSEESAVNDFAVHLLTLLGYVPRARMVHTCTDIPLNIRGRECHAKTDVCVVDSDDILLLVQEDKRHKDPKDPEPQLIAGVIAVFQTNNYRRTHVLGQDPIAYMERDLAHFLQDSHHHPTRSKLCTWRLSCCTHCCACTSPCSGSPRSPSE